MIRYPVTSPQNIANELVLATGTTTPRTLADRFADPINILDFGAVGDGITNCTAAIQSAVNHVASLGGGTIVFPYGTYLIDATITINKGIMLVGVGELGNTTSSSISLDGTVIKWSGSTSVDMFQVKSDVVGQYLYGFGVENIVFWGSNVAATAIRASSIAMANMAWSAVAFTEAGVVVDDANGVLSVFNNYRFKYIYGSVPAVENSHGLVLDGSASDQGVTQSVIYWANGLVKNGWMLRFKDSDGFHVLTSQASVASGGTGGCIYFANGDVRPARNMQIEVMWGKAYAESQVYGIDIKRAHSEAGGIGIAAGGQMHYTAYDYMTAARWATHSFVMSDQMRVGAGEMQTEIEFVGYATYDPPSLADGDGAQTNITVTGCLLGDIASASFSLDTQGIILNAQVTASNTVTVRFQNETGGTIDLGSGTVRVKVVAHPTRTAIRGEAADLWSGVKFSQGISTATRFNIVSPYHWSNGTILGVILYHAQSTTNTAKNVRINVKAITSSAGTSISTPQKDESFTVAVNNAALRYTTTQVTFTTPLSFTQNDFLAFHITRLGQDVLDTASGDWILLGASIIYNGIGPQSPGSGTWSVPPISV